MVERASTKEEAMNTMNNVYFVDSPIGFSFIYIRKFQRENAKGRKKTTSFNNVLVVGVGIEHSRDGVVVASFDPSIICLLHYTNTMCMSEPIQSRA